MTTATSVFDSLTKIAPAVCPMCGEELKTTKVLLAGKTYRSLPCFGSCGCSESAAKLAEMDGVAKRTNNDKLQAYAKAGIGESFFAAQVENPEHLQAVKDGGSLFITGDVGSGKTYLASALAMRLIDEGMRVRFETTVGLLRELRGVYESKTTDAFERCIGCDVLVLDDLGKETPTEFALATLYEIIDIRYANSLPNIITSNYQGDGLVARMAQTNSETARAIVSRICGMCKGIELNGRDRRREWL